MMYSPLSLLGKDGSILTARARLVSGAVATRETLGTKLFKVKQRHLTLTPAPKCVSHLPWVLIDNSDHSRHSTLFLNHIQTRSISIRNISHAIISMEVSCINGVPQEGFSSTLKYWNLSCEKEEENSEEDKRSHVWLGF